MGLPVLANNSDKKNKSLFTMRGEAIDFGAPDSFRFNVLTKVMTEKYEVAVQMLNDFQSEPSEYPDYKSKASRYIQHSIELIQSIKAKRGFSGMDSLTSTKQQELIEQFKGQIKSLQHTLKSIEKIEGDLRVQDVRSTIYVVSAFWYALLTVVIFAFILECAYGLLSTGLTAGDGFMGDLAHFVATKIGF
jgi:hypothetical protein